MTAEDTNPRPDGHAAEPLALRLNDLLGQASEARWYCMDRDGVAMLCKDEADARAQVIENDDCWPGRAPHRAVLLIEANAADAHIPMGRLIELEAAEHERDILRTDNAKLVREAHTWSKAAETYAADAERLRAEVKALRELWDEAETENDSLRVEAPTPALRRAAERSIVAWTVVRGGVWDPNGLMDEHMDALRKALGPNATMEPLDPLDVEEMWDQANADERADEVHHAFARLVERAHGIGPNSALTGHCPKG